VKELRHDPEAAFFRLQSTVERMTAWLPKNDRDAAADFLTARARALLETPARTPAKIP